MARPDVPRGRPGGETASANHAATDSHLTVQRCSDACRPVEVWFGGTLYSRHVTHWHGQPGGTPEWGSYDVVTLGLAPHPRETCASCQAVGT